MATLILIRGIPGSGKSTLAREINRGYNNSDPGISAVFEADQFFMIEDEYKFDANKLREAHEWCQKQTRAQLERGGVAIVSNTFTTRRELKPYFAMAKEFDILPVVYLAQNQFKNVHGVPEEKLKLMRERFQFDISELYGETHD